MRKLVTAVALALALAPAARAAETKIAVIDIQKAMLECDEGKAISEQLAGEMKVKQAQLDAKQNELKGLQADFEKQSAVMDEKTRAVKEEEFGKRMNELREMYMKLQQELGKKEQEATKGIAGKMRQVVKEVADGSGTDLVIDSAVLIYGDPVLDITSEVIRKYNAKFPYKAAGGKPAAKPAGGKAK